MSRAKRKARAITGKPFRNEPVNKTYRTYICANCHRPLDSTFVKVDDYYYHEYCRKVMMPLVTQAVD